MSRRNPSKFNGPQSLRRNYDLLRADRQKKSKGRSHIENFYSFTTNVSDSGTYEIEISESSSPDMNKSEGTIRSESLALWNCCSKTVSSSMSSKSFGSLVSDTTNYPCFCIATLDLSGSKRDMSVNTEAEQSINPLRLISSENISERKDRVDSLYTSDTERKCKNSECKLSDLEPSSAYGSTYRKSVSKSTSTQSALTEKSCDCPQCKDCTGEGTKSDIVISDGAILQDGSAVETSSGLVPKEKRLRIQSKAELRGCENEENQFEGRLSTSESVHAPETGTEEGEESGTKSRDRSCECATTLLEFAEMKNRIDKLEKLYNDSFGPKKQSSKEESEVKFSLSGSEGTFRSNGTPKPSAGAYSESLDEEKTTTELNKIKTRLINLEEKIAAEKLFFSHSIQRDKSLITNTGTHSGSVVMNQMSDKVIQVIDLDESEISKSWTSPDHEFLPSNVTACWMMKNFSPWDKVTLRDEAVQTHSQGQREMYDANRGFPSTKKKQRNKKSFDEVHLCQECNQYINQKLGSQCQYPEELLRGMKLYENVPLTSEEVKKARKVLCNDNDEEDCFYPRKSSFIKEMKKIMDKKSKRDKRKLKLRPKSSKTNLKEEFVDFVIKEGCEVGYPWALHAQSKSNKRLAKDLERYKSVQNAKKSFQIYHAQEMSRSLLLRHRSKELQRHRRKKRMKRSSPNMHRHFSPRNRTKTLCENGLAKEYRSWESTCTLTTNAIRDSIISCNRSPYKRNKLKLLEGLKSDRKMEIPILFEEISSENELMQHPTKMSLSVVRKKQRKKKLNPLKKLVGTLSHSQPLAEKEDSLTFDIPENRCTDSPKVGQQEKSKKTNLITLPRSSWK